MRALMLIAAAGLVASCSRPAMPPGSSFAEATAGRIPGPPQSCIGSSPAENLHPLDSQDLAFGFGRTIYINHLKAPCPAMSVFNTLIIEPSLGSEYCSGDRIRSLEPGSIIPGPTCILDQWVPYRLP